MNTRKVKDRLERVLVEWASTFPTDLKSRVLKHSIITGGSIVSLLKDEEVNDYDIYFTNVETAELLLAHYCEGSKLIRGSKVMERDGGSYLYVDVNSEGFLKLPKGESKFQPICITSNALTLSDKIQIIFRFCGEPESIHSNFDFVHCTNYFSGGNLHLSTAALQSIVTKELSYVGSLYPLASIMRTRKFINRGWTINAGQYLKMCIQLQSFDLSNFDVLKDQLMSVDALYFQQMLGSIQQDQVISGRIDNSYLINLINKFF